MLVPGTVNKSGEEARPWSIARRHYSNWCQWSLHSTNSKFCFGWDWWKI